MIINDRVRGLYFHACDHVTKYESSLIQHKFKANEEDQQQRISNVQYLTPSKGEKHWLLSHPEGL